MNTILFDLDGTLLPIDMKIFEKVYFSELCQYFKDLLPQDKLIECIWKSTETMVRNIELRTNEEVFFEDFSSRVGTDTKVFIDRFNTFYDTNFQKVKSSVKVVPSMRESIKVLKDKGYAIVIATNPLFPEKAIHHRVQWAGFDPKEFQYISTFEKNHYCKPQLHYYREILEHIKKSPEECMMVGNDVQEDLIAGTLGMKTYLISDYLLHRTQENIKSDYIGNYDEFLEFTMALPSII